MRTILYLVALMVITGLGVEPALAQDNPADNMEIVREKIRADKKLVVADERDHITDRRFCTPALCLQNQVLQEAFRKGQIAHFPSFPS